MSVETLQLQPPQLRIPKKTNTKTKEKEENLGGVGKNDLLKLYKTKDKSWKKNKERITVYRKIALYTQYLERAFDTRVSYISNPGCLLGPSTASFFVSVSWTDLECLSHLSASLGLRWAGRTGSSGNSALHIADTSWVVISLRTSGPVWAGFARISYRGGHPHRWLFPCKMLVKYPPHPSLPWIKLGLSFAFEAI